MARVQTCAKCGAGLDASAPSGHCLACLLSLGLPEPEAHGLAVPVAESVGDRIGRYRLLEQIGEGGCGMVYRAQQEEPVRREVALKVIKLGMDTRSVIARFEAERQALALMDHVNIARVLDAGATATGRPFFVMELVRGPRITDYCDTHGLSTRERLELFIQVGEAVQHAHQKGVIHRDLKPSNVLVALNDGRPVPKIIDFGIAKATGDQPLTDRTVFTALGQFLGTPAYMSPEQAGSEGDVDTRTDVYSLGVLLYELLTGNLPFTTEELRRAAAGKVAQIIRERQPLRPSARLTTMAVDELTLVAQRRNTAHAALSREVAGDLDWIVMKALEKDREHRYSSATGFVEDLRRYLRDEPVTARAPNRLRQTRRLIRQHWVLFAATTAVLLSLSLGLALALGSLRREKAATSEARMISSASEFLQAQNLAKENHFGRALTALARSLRFDSNNHVAVTRMASLMTSHTWMIPSLTLPHEGNVDIVKFSPDGRYVVTVSKRGSPTSENQPIVGSDLSVWDAFSGKHLYKISGPGVIRSIAVSSNGERFVTTSDLPSTNTISIVWQASNGQKISERAWRPSGFWGGNPNFFIYRTSSQFSPSGNTILTVNDGKVFLWDTKSGRISAEWSVPIDIDQAQFSPDEKSILLYQKYRFNTSQVYKWNLSDNGYLEVLSLRPDNAKYRTGTERGRLTSAQFSTDGKRIIATYEDGSSQSCDPQTFALQTNALVSEHFEFPGVQNKNTKNSAYIAVLPQVDAVRVITVRDRWSGQLLAEPAKQQAHQDQAVYDFNEKFGVTPTDRGAVVVETQTGRIVASLESKREIWSTTFSSHGTRIATTEGDRNVRIWDSLAVAAPVQSLRPKLTPDLRLSEDRGHLLSSDPLSPDRRHFVTVHSDRFVRVWDAKTGELASKAMPHKGQIYSARYTSDGRKLLTISAGLTASIWNAKTGEMLDQPLKEEVSLKNGCFSMDASQLVAWSEDSISIYNAPEWKQRIRLSAPDKSKILGGVLGAGNGRLIVCYKRNYAEEDKTNSGVQFGWQIWNPINGEPLTAMVWDSPQIPRSSSMDAGARTGETSRRSGKFVTDKVRDHDDNFASLVTDYETKSVLNRLIGTRIQTEKHPRVEVFGFQSILRNLEVSSNSENQSAEIDSTGAVGVLDACTFGCEIKVCDVKTGQVILDNLPNPGSYEKEDFQHGVTEYKTEYKPVEDRLFGSFSCSIPGGSLHKSYRIWYIAPNDTNPPDWLLDLADAVAGVSTVDSSLRELGNAERLATMEHIRQRLNRETGTNVWLRWGRWFLADPATRPPTPAEMPLPVGEAR